MRYLDNAHPVVSFAYLVFVLGISVFSRDPLVLALSASGGLLCAGLCGKLHGMAWLPVTALAAALLNPIFSHSGATVLFFVGNTAFTLESLAYGAVFGVMLSAAVLWSAAGTRFMTSDKYIWLFGKIAPSAGMVLSCTLRFVPLFIKRTGDFARARVADGARKKTSLKVYLSAFSDSIGYSAEEAVQSAESMRSRGYGTGRRTFYSQYTFGTRDAAALGAVALLGGISAALMMLGYGGFAYYPYMKGFDFSAGNIALYSLFGALCFMPALSVAAEYLRRKVCVESLK